MMREVFVKHNFGLNKEFRFRGTEPGRLENFSDACFALAITLLLISTSPPTNFSHLQRFVWDLIPFCLCITLILLIWRHHFYLFLQIRTPKSERDRSKHVLSYNCTVLCVSSQVPDKRYPLSDQPALWTNTFTSRTKRNV